MIKEHLHAEWVSQVKIIGPVLKAAIGHPLTLPLRVKIASHSILSAAATTRNNQFRFVEFLAEKEKQIQAIDSMAGLSPELLLLIQYIDHLTLCPTSEENKGLWLKDRLERLEQRSSIDSVDQRFQGKLNRERALRETLQGAETYRLAAILYLEYRVFGYVGIVNSLLRC